MPIYDYRVVDKYGVGKEGSMSATNEEEVADFLKSQNLTIIKIQTSSEKWGKFINIFGKRRIPALDMVNFMDNLSTMIKSGLTFLDAISVIKDDTKNPKLKEILTDVEYNLESGITLSSTLLKYPDVFDGSVISLIKAGEISGQLEDALSNLAFKLKQDYELSRNVKSSLAYPLVIFSILIVLATSITIFILPRLAEAFSRMTTQLPISIRILMIVGNFLRHYWYLLIIAIVIFIWAIFRFLKSRMGRRLINNIAMRIPLIKDIVLYIDLARYSFVLSMFLKSGVPITEALHMAPSSIFNDNLRKAALKFEDQVTAGSTLTKAVQKAGSSFPAFMKQMINTGEKTGHLDESFLKVGNFYREEINIKLKTLTSVIEPILMLIIGLLVALFVVSIISPIYQIIGNFKMR